MDVPRHGATRIAAASLTAITLLTAFAAAADSSRTARAQYWGGYEAFGVPAYLLGFNPHAYWDDGYGGAAFDVLAGERAVRVGFEDDVSSVFLRAASFWDDATGEQVGNGRAGCRGSLDLAVPDHDGPIVLRVIVSSAFGCAGVLVPPPGATHGIISATFTGG